MNDTYQFTSKADDIVQMPDGTEAKVVDEEYEIGGCSKVITVKPTGKLSFLQELVWFLNRFGRYAYRDSEINSLTLIERD